MSLAQSPVPAEAAAMRPTGTRSVSATDREDQDQDDSRSTSSSNSVAPEGIDNEESDFYLNHNDSESSLGVPAFQDMAVDDACLQPVERLPNEILIGIFSRLSSTTDLYHCLLVCKRWARNSVDLLWHRPSCNNWDNHIYVCRTLSTEKPFFSYKHFIRRLNLAGLGEKVNDGSVMPLSVCPRIERLTLPNCRNIGDTGLISLVTNSPWLLALDVMNDKNITEKSIDVIAEHCKLLQGINVSGCDQISNESLINLAQSCKAIKRLKLNELTQLNDTAVIAFADNCPKILEIDLQQCNLITNGPISSLLSKGEQLRELRLAGCDLVDDSAFLSLPGDRSFEHLRILDLTACHRVTDNAVVKIVKAAPRLRNLVLAKCRWITDLSLFAISELGKNLHYVHLGHCGQITDEGVKKLVTSCNRIRYIDLGCCTNLTDASVRRLSNLPKLKRIGLVKCASITDDSVLALAEAAWRPRLRREVGGGWYGAEFYASSLERVHLSYCTNLTLKSILRLLNSCPRLTHLSLTGVAAFQRDDFTPYCRQAPPEFTQHQRDVFCVFSGNMVSQFRHYLNSDRQFENLRAAWPVQNSQQQQRPRRGQQSHQAGVPFVLHHTPDGEGDEDMGDDNDDYEGMNGSHLEGQQHVPQPPPPPPPPLAQPLFGLPAGTANNPIDVDTDYSAPSAAFPPHPDLSLGPNNHQQPPASYASATSPPTGFPGHSYVNGAQGHGPQPNGGASTAPLYQPSWEPVMADQDHPFDLPQNPDPSQDSMQ